MIYQLYVQFGREYRVSMVEELCYMTTCEPAVRNYCNPGLGFVCISFVPSVTKVYPVLKIVNLLFILWTQNMFALLQATHKTERASFTMFI